MAFRWRWPMAPFMVLLVFISLSNYASSLDLDTSQMEISQHPKSPRSKRQAYPVYSSANGKVTVEVVGQREAGPWNDWTVSRECSLTCGGGVKIETRDCSGSGCIGPRKRYVSCNIEPCAQGAKDFSRTSQCSANNDKPLQGRYYKWKPYTKAPNKCELNCMPDGESFYYKWADKVIDGTKCDQMTNDVCVEGFCLPLGCDGKLGSTQKEDKCRVCGGDGTTCKTQKGFFDERHMAPGYIDIITLPIGSTTIVIQENKPTNNYLALRNDSGHYFLNGNWKIDFPQTVEIGGTLFEYERTRQGTVGVEKLVAKGPTTEPVIVVLLFQAENTGIQYEYSVPLDETLPHTYLLGEWEQCSVTCGKGLQVRKATCVESISKSPVDEELCVNSSLPETNRSCNSIDCENEWFEGEWEDCSRTCGKDGLQYRTVYCHKVSADGTRVTVDDAECLNNASTPRPPVKQNCNRFECPEWLSGPWSSCSKDCGDAMQYRAITCRSEKEGEEGKLLGSKNCNDTMKPEDRRTCNLGPCEGLRWVMGDWQLCSKCNDTTETRNVSCENEHGRRYPEEKCKEKRPADSRDCATVIPCVYKWHSSQWSDCSSGCGHGHQTRTVVCAIDEDGYLRKMDDSFCLPELKPDGRQNCTHENEKCTGTYYSSPWTNCTAECAGGTQNRIVVCFDYDYKIRPQLCDEDLRPPETQDCNTDRCLFCNETDFGCCPDKMTPASGLYFDGCSNCSLSEFGCCPDNYTEATNKEKEGCPIEIVIEEDFSGEGMGANDTMKNATVKLMAECETSVFGCCPDGNTTATTADQSDCPEVLCNFTSASGDTKMLPCTNVTAMMNDTDILLLGNDTMMGMNDTESNITIEIHCSKTEFGCCPDWYTPANGTDFVGCPEYDIGNCNDTKHGCCPDGLTLARGPKFEGCGDPSCAASLFGCCKDRLTIAFGTHYGGCERANQPCETSKFGCCSDGLTAALGMDGEGCEEDCRLTKFGCCPDGKTTAKGKNNEGCKCSDSQYGCCPDGKTAAEGLNYHGCPDSCARSYYGCCPDGKTPAQGSFKEGCPCVYTQHGCCPDGETAARGPKKEGCDDCRLWKFGCCIDGVTKALGPDRSGCDEEMRVTTGYTRPQSGTVSPNKIAACTLPKVEGQVCADYTIMWFYDAKEGACRQFWYGGCAGNDNRFTSEAECRDTCIEPPGFGVCYLPKIEGPQDCGDVKPRWYYDLRRGQCTAFYYNGCNGNANNFEQYDECMSRCDSVEIPGGPARTNGNGDQRRPEEDQRRVDDEYRRPDEDYRRPEDDQRRQEEERRRLEEDQRRPDDDGRRPEEDYRRPDDDQRPYDNQRQSQEQRGGYTEFPATDREDFITPTHRGGDHIEDDDTSQSEVCDWPPESGPCQAFRDMWYFDRQSRQCSTFKYGGCDGNPNRFLSREECEQICRHKLVSVPLEETQICSLPAAKGPCKAKLTKYYYEPAWSRCTTFDYGGCDGNANRFDTVQECQAKCEKTAYDVNGDQCTLPKDSGPCDIYVPKWYFNSADGTCGRFYYGGCHGNRNRFDSLEECETKCASKIDPCTLPPVQGPCNSRETRWHYDQKSRSCKHFTFGGCLGNSNNFLSSNECETKCSGKTNGRTQSLTGRTAVVSASVTDEAAKTDFCQLPPVSGRCGEYHYKYYFNSVNSRCEAFVYSGCDGNENRFDRLEDCERRCTSRHRSQNYQADVNSDNLLDTEADALRTPHIMTTAEPEQEQSVPEGNDNDDICHLPLDKGPCRQHNVRWYFDTTMRKCKEFIYGGCLGNYNNFETLERCEDYCVSDDQVVPQGGLEKPRQSQSNNGHQEIIEDRVPPPQSYPAPTSLLPELCKQPMDTGDCFEDLLRYYYDSEKQRCQSFKYTNCKGNSNRFLSMEECERGCGQYRDAGVCALPADEGHCFASTNKWFWSSATASCETFIYSGCGGNGNRFGSKEECESLCRKETETQADVCELHKVVGPCRAALERYHYNIRTRKCEKFVYGGCRGNDNNFQSKDACQERCSHVESDVTDLCLFTRDAGPCTESVTQYYYDTPTGECKLFTYGGCRGNMNRFDTKNQCESRCKGKRTEAITMSKEAVCRQPFDHGPCSDQAVRYYYNINENKCETFVYGGCSGNENRFFSEKECVDMCSGVMSRPNVAHISSHPRSREMVNVIVEMSHASQDTPTTVFLHCQVRPVQSHNILWFKNNKRINSNENPRFNMMRNGTLQITSAVHADGGNYTCAASDINNGLTSPPVIVEIKTPQHQQPLKQCVDDPSKANCAMVKKSGLCDHKYYGVFCCKTCQEVRALKKAKKMKLKA